MNNQRSKSKNQTSIRGFSLVEVLIATVLVGMAIAALVAANGSFSMANVAGADLSTAEFLVEQIRELTTMLPVADPDATTWTVLGPDGETLAGYDDVDDLDGFNSTSVGAPINAQRAALTNLATFSQEVIVQRVNPSNFDEVWSDDHDPTSNFVRITVNIRANGRPVSSASWIRARY